MLLSVVTEDFVFVAYATDNLSGGGKLLMAVRTIKNCAEDLAQG